MLLVISEALGIELRADGWVFRLFPPVLIEDPLQRAAVQTDRRDTPVSEPLTSMLPCTDPPFALSKSDLVGESIGLMEGNEFRGS